ncbi:MAG: DUF1902 domain-containing protein [Alphaproteobacteria bacterium]|nr:DUF1902 domain-containing protein [Alphaproteobacteria bacterium]
MAQDSLTLDQKPVEGGIVVLVERLPEGVWLGTSDDLETLIVETETLDEMIDAAPQVAADLLELDGKAPIPRDRFRFIVAGA